QGRENRRRRRAHCRWAEAGGAGGRRWPVAAAAGRRGDRPPAEPGSRGSAQPRGQAMTISETFIRRPLGTALLTLGLALVGLVAYGLLPIAPLPQIDLPTIQVTASYPGADPETMASSVATPLERQFAQIAGITQMTSLSGVGNTTITIQFDL